MKDKLQPSRSGIAEIRLHDGSTREVWHSHERLEDYIREEIVIRFIVDPLNRISNDNNTFKLIAARNGIYDGAMGFDARLDGLNLALRDTKVGLDDVIHRTGEFLYHASKSRLEPQAVIYNAKRIAEQTDTSQELYNFHKGQWERRPITMADIYAARNILSLGEKRMLKRSGTSTQFTREDGLLEPILIALHELDQDVPEENRVSMPDAEMFTQSVYRFGRIVGKGSKKDPYELFLRYYENDGWFNFRSLPRQCQLGFLGTCLEEIGEHTIGVAANNPNLQKQVYAFAQFCFREQETTSSDVNTALVHEHVRTFLDEQSNFTNINIRAIDQLCRQLLQDQDTGMEAAGNLIIEVPKPKAYPTIEGKAARRLEKVTDTTIIKSPNDILTEYDELIETVTQKPRYMRYGLALELLLEVRNHLSTGNANERVLIAQYETWCKQLRPLTSAPQYAKGDPRNAIHSFSSEKSTRIDPIIVIDQIKDFLETRRSQRTLKVGDTIELAEDLLANPDNGLEAYEKPVERVGKTYEKGKQLTVEKGGTFLDRTRRVLNFPVWAWDGLFDKLPTGFPAIRRTGKYAIYAGEAITIAKVMENVPGFGFLRRIDESYQNFVADMATTAQENEWVQSPVIPPIRKFFADWLPDRLRMAQIGSSDLWDSVQSNLYRLNTGVVLDWIAQSPTAMYAFGALSAGLIYRAGHAALSGITGDRLPHNEQDFRYYFGRGIHAVASWTLFPLPWAVKKIGTAVEKAQNMPGLFTKYNEWTKDYPKFTSKNEER